MVSDRCVADSRSIVSLLADVQVARVLLAIRRAVSSKAVERCLEEFNVSCKAATMLYFIMTFGTLLCATAMLDRQWLVVPSGSWLCDFLR